MNHRRIKHRLACLSIALVALSLSMTAPSFAEEAGKVSSATQVQTAPDLQLDLAEAPSMTPAEPEDLEVQDLEIQLDPSRGLRVEKIRICEPEEEALCPPGCLCLFVRNAVECRCF